MKKLEKSIGYVFTNDVWLKQSLTHRSHGSKNNERLEFVGDSILNYTVARMLYDQFPKFLEGDLSHLRASLVNQTTLADIARSLSIGDYLLLGEGERKSGGFNRSSILADALEAIFAAVSFDSDFLQAECVVRRLYENRIKDINPKQQFKDPKTQLQELLQANHLALPIYNILAQSGDAHDQIFKVSCELSDQNLIAWGEASSRRAAEQIAAASIIQSLSLHIKKRTN